MKKITKPTNLVEFNDKIVVLTPKSSYYGNAYEHKITKKGLVFACISQDSINHSKTVEKITSNEAISRIDIDLFGTCHRVTTTVTTDRLRQEESGSLEMRPASAKEIAQLQKLVQDNKMILACQTKEKTLKILSDYLHKKFGMYANEATVASSDEVHISGTNEKLE
ncbi:MAG: hypothetical protein PG979_000653 [Rickettsia asembonensis]|nr:hypothetical protein [Rickettsia asembonensis]WCR56596.1 MAG: hypothetical protein PG979_000653 [Rickettsia asembonensis]